MNLSIKAVCCRHLSPRNSHNLFWYINDWKVIDMPEILRISLGKLKMAINIFTCSLLILLLLVIYSCNQYNGWGLPSA